MSDNIKSLKFSFQQVGALLLKDAGIKEGFWNIGFDTIVNVGTIGASPEEARPGVNLLLENITLTKLEGEIVRTMTVIDAASIS